MARVKKGVFSWDDVLAQRYQNNKPPPRSRRKSPHSPHLPQPQRQPQCALLTRLSPELRLIIWEMALGGHRLHIIQRSGQRLGHVICPCPLGPGPGPDSGTRPESGSRPRLGFFESGKMNRGVGEGPFCEICHGAGIVQPVKEKDGEGLLGVGCAARGRGRGRDGLLGLVLTCRQMYGEWGGWLALFPRPISPVLGVAIAFAFAIQARRNPEGSVAFTESIHLLYATNTFEFSIPWSLPYLQPTIPRSYWECIRAVELRWSFPGHWLPTKDPVRAIYVSAGRAQWLETCRAVKQLPALRSFVLVLGSSWFSEPVEKLPVFLEPLGGLAVGERKHLVMRDEVEIEVEDEDGMEWGSSLDGWVSSSESRASFESSASSSRLTRSSASSLRSEGSACSCLDAGLSGSMDLTKSDAGTGVDAASATWELRLQGQSYYAHDVGQIGDDLQRRGIDCWISTV